jgi:hypothetical protein
MSRTTRTLPRWVKRQIIHSNNLCNNYREPQMYHDGVAYELMTNSRGRNQRTDNEHTAWYYGSDNGKRNLYRCNHNTEVGKMTGSWTMGEAWTQATKAHYRKVWARNNRRYSKAVAAEELAEYYVPYVPDDDTFDEYTHETEFSGAQYHALDMRDDEIAFSDCYEAA